MDSFYIITNILKDKDYAVTDKICNYIEQKGKKWTLAKKDEEGHILPGTVPSDVECGLVLGGDGTLIRAIRDLEGEELPLLGDQPRDTGISCRSRIERIISMHDRCAEKNTQRSNCG